MAALAQTGSRYPRHSRRRHSRCTAHREQSGIIDMQEAIAGSNEGARDFEALTKKFEPRRLELQNLNTDIENLKKQLTTQGDKMNPEARATLVKSIETKTEEPAAFGGRCAERISAAAE